MSKDLKTQLIRLGSEKPELQDNIRPILAYLEPAKLVSDMNKTVEKIERGLKEDYWKVEDSLEDLGRALYQLQVDVEEFENYGRRFDNLVKEVVQAHREIERELPWGTRVDDLLVKLSKQVKMLQRF